MLHLINDASTFICDKYINSIEVCVSFMNALCWLFKFYEVLSLSQCTDE